MAEPTPETPETATAASTPTTATTSPTSPSALLPPRKHDMEDGAPRAGYLRVAAEHTGLLSRHKQWKKHHVVVDARSGVVFSKDEEAYARGETMMVLEFSQIDSVEAMREGHFAIHIAKDAQKAIGTRVLLDAGDAAAAADWVAALAQRIMVRARVYTVGLNGEFPENARGVRPGTSACFSGGGGRAHVCAAGQLRALHHLGLLDCSVLDYFSAVSAGAWTTAIYEFYEKGASSDDELFGPLCSPRTTTCGSPRPS